MARETSQAFTATQFALFSTFIAVPRTVANASTGFIVEAVGWTQFFVICAIAAIPGMLLLLKVAPWTEKERPSRLTINRAIAAWLWLLTKRGDFEEIEARERAAANSGDRR